jgi:hypothetical protein
LRTAVLVLASVLVSPHAFVYDAVVLAPVLIWLAGWVYGEVPILRGTSPFFALGVYGLCLSLLVPTAAIVPIQLSVFVLAGLFVTVSRDVVHWQRDAVEHALVAVPSQS